MNRYFRVVLFLICAVQAIFAIAFALQLPLALQVWPFPATTPLTYIFLGSIFLAAVASTLWVAAAQHYGALAGIGLDYIAIFTPLAIFAFQVGVSNDSTPITVFGALCIVGALFGIGITLWSIRIPIENSPPLPGLVKWSFVVFVIALLLVGGRLILKVPNVIPWNVTPELSVIIGWIFLGAATYFAYTLLRPSWYNAAGQLAGFLAYDMVLIGPFLKRLPTVAPEHRLSLILYMVVVTYSGLLAIYYLFINRQTRIIGGRSYSPRLAE